MGRLLLALLVFFVVNAAHSHTRHYDDDLSSLQLLGKNVFFDEISSPEGAQGCSSCHVPQAGWTSPLSNSSVMPGAVSERFGNRKPPSNAYIVFSPIRDVEERTGGALWDARAEGNVLQTIAGLEDVDPDLFGPAADQSILPFTNPLEHNTTAEAVCRHVESSSYSHLYEKAWDKRIDCEGGLEESFARIGLSIVAYEASHEVSAFASRFDAGALSPEEREGFELFVGRATCSGCHTVEEGAEPGDGSDQLFTNFKTFNIGTPRNPDNPFYDMDVVVGNDGEIINPLGEAFIDVGDGTGRVKVPTLRNVGKRPTKHFVRRFTHNGFFNSLQSIVHFYNTRDVLEACPPGFDVDEALENDCWPAPENTENLAGEGTEEADLGNLGLTAQEEEALVAFLYTLSDNVIVLPPTQERQYTRRTYEPRQYPPFDNQQNESTIEQEESSEPERRWERNRQWFRNTRWPFRSRARGIILRRRSD